MEGWYKQRDNRLYPAWAYLAPTIILRLPYSLAAALLWCCIVYYPVGLAPEPGRCARAPSFSKRPTCWLEGFCYFLVTNPS